MTEEQAKQEENEVVEEAPRRPPPRKVSVRVVETVGGQTALVQWNAGTAKAPEFARGYVPLSVVEDDCVKENALAAAAPYAVDWATMTEKISISPEALRRALWNKGIYTLDDLALKHGVVSNVLRELVGIADVIQKAKERT